MTEPPDLRTRLHNILDNFHDGGYGSTIEAVDALMEAIRREAIVGMASATPSQPATVHPLDDRTVSVWTFARPPHDRDVDAATDMPVVTIGGVTVPGVVEVAVCAPPVVLPPITSHASRFEDRRPAFVEVVMRVRSSDARRLFTDGVYAWVTKRANTTRVPYVDRHRTSHGVIR